MTKSKAGRRPDKRQRLLERAADHWDLAFENQHGRLPTWRRPDFLALIDIALLQCAHDYRRIQRTLDDLISGPFKGPTLTDRWIEFIAYCEDGRPRRPRGLTSRRRRQLLAMVRQNAFLARGAFVGAS